MDDLMTFLRARLAEDEADQGSVHDGDCAAVSSMSRPCDCRQPARVLRELEAKRAILADHALEVKRAEIARFDSYTGERNPDEYDVICEVCGWASQDPGSACRTLRLLAAIYSGHPDYRQEWKP